MANLNLQRAAELEAEAKALRRAEKKFWDDIEGRKEEILEHFGVGQFIEAQSDILSEVAMSYGISSDELYDYITSDSVRGFYQRWRQRQAQQD